MAELVNKINGPWFSKFDEDLATAFSIYCGISIAHVRPGGGPQPSGGGDGEGGAPTAEGSGGRDTCVVPVPWGQEVVVMGSRGWGWRVLGEFGGGLPTPRAPVSPPPPAVAAVQEGERGAVPQPPGQ